MKALLADYNIEELNKLFGDQPKFRAKQIFKWLHNGADFADMTDIPQNFREYLAQNYDASSLKIIKTLSSQKDNTQKFLYQLNDGNVIEGVVMEYKHGFTICVSTQVGCRMGCAFCASGIGGLVRNLSAGEILGQVIEINRYLGGTITDRKITNIVLMGSGEPLDNYQNVTKFLNLVSCHQGINISQRNISLSTCGICDNIIRLADDGFKITLTISLHSAIDKIRKTLMPIANKYTVSDIVNAAKYYFEKTGRRIIYEYAMISDKNMDNKSLEELVKITKGYSCHINLIMLNYVKEKGLKPCAYGQAKDFANKLKKHNVSVTIRRSMGSDIEGACGQLRNTVLKELR
ncbi:MAG TPA: 23S rRNA (adenine(2503)-C(2))-methyltransferase RlmN [Clostridiales bacterium]|nr:23S rRNA (adenine(2503)-C(2))-methyltransferase RlmN [Clostridiales bacterium]